MFLKIAERYGVDRISWVLQEDNDPKHRSRVCTEWKLQNIVFTLDWLASSPDTNTIENV